MTMLGIDYHNGWFTGYVTCDNVGNRLSQQLVYRICDM